VAFERFKSNQAWMSLLSGIGVKALYDADLIRGLPADTIKRARKDWEHSADYLKFRQEIDDFAREVDRTAHALLPRASSFREVHLARKPETKLVRLAGILSIIESPSSRMPERRRKKPTQAPSARKQLGIEIYLGIVAIAITVYFGLFAVIPASISLGARALGSLLGALVIGVAVFIAIYFAWIRKT